MTQKLTYDTGKLFKIFIYYFLYLHLIVTGSILGLVLPEIAS